MKKITAGICAMVLAAGTSTAVFGQYLSTDTSRVEISREIKSTGSRNMNDTRLKPVILKEKWDSLNDTQKEEVYRLKDITIDVECQIIDKYIEFGIIDKEAGERVKAKKSEYKAEMRKSGKLPGYHEKANREKKFKQ